MLADNSAVVWQIQAKTLIGSWMDGSVGVEQPLCFLMGLADLGLDVRVVGISVVDNLEAEHLFTIANATVWKEEPLLIGFLIWIAALQINLS